MMKVLITGGCGYIGSFVADHLVDTGAEVSVITRDLRKCGKLRHASAIRFFEGTLLDRDFVLHALKESRPAAVVHAAWAGSTRRTRNSPLQADNLMALGNLLNALIASGTDCFIGFGTQAEYGTHNRRIDETFWPQPLDQYGVYKLAAGLAGRQFAFKNSLRYAWLRLFSSFGPGDHAEFLLPHVMLSLLDGVVPELTTCEQRWDYLYVKDIPRLVERVVVYSEDYCDIFNLCSGATVQLKELIRLVCEKTRSTVAPKFGAMPSRTEGLFHLEGDNSKFKSTFGWVELTGLDTAVTETVEWFRSHRSEYGVS